LQQEIKVTKALVVLAALSSLLGAEAHAAEVQFANVQAGSYKIETLHTQVVFSLLHFGFTHFTGFFSGATDTLDLDPAKLRSAKLQVSIPTESVTTNVASLNSELKGNEWFDAAQFPQATFESTRVVPAPNGATVTGNLTLHGVTKPVILHVRFIGAGVNPIDKA
jgi:polyisoprenoid-binding protein YceI